MTGKRYASIAIAITTIASPQSNDIQGLFDAMSLVSAVK